MNGKPFSNCSNVNKAAAWEHTASQFNTNAAFISSVKVFKPHLPSSSPRALPNTPLNVKLVSEEIHPLKLYLSI